jgi:hypothetical protein
MFPRVFPQPAKPAPRASGMSMRISESVIMAIGREAVAHNLEQALQAADTFIYQL